MAKKTSTSEEIDAYISEFPAEIAAILTKVRSTVRKAAPQAEEGMKYKLPTLVYNGNLVHFGGFKTHIGLYPTPSGIAAFQEELSGYKCAKGSVQFPIDKPIPFSLIAKIVKFRMKENQQKATRGKR